jgi:hypothetical protein
MAGAGSGRFTSPSVTVTNGRGWQGRGGQRAFTIGHAAERLSSHVDGDVADAPLLPHIPHLAMIEALHPFCKSLSEVYPSRRIGSRVADVGPAVPVGGRSETDP